MKKFLYTILLSSAGFASETPEEVKLPESVISHHEITPNFRWLKHSEYGFTYSKFIGGLEYNYIRSSGVNFNSFIGYSFYKDKTYFMADWGVKYVSNAMNNLDWYPLLGISNTSHFSTDANDQTFQIYRSAFNAGFGGIYNFRDFVVLDLSVNYFKDLATSCVLSKGDEFWGKNYYSPSGIKVNANFRFPTFLSKPIEIGGFYSRTIKKCYKEYGFKTSVAFTF
jgi:hypothetical protein